MKKNLKINPFTIDALLYGSTVEFCFIWTRFPENPPRFKLLPHVIRGLMLGYG